MCSFFFHFQGEKGPPGTDGLNGPPGLRVSNCKACFFSYLSRGIRFFTHELRNSGFAQSLKYLKKY